MERKTQKAGNNATQIQAESITIGIDEKRIREIFDEKITIAIKDFSEEAAKIAVDRINEFEERLISRIIELENGLNAFADPNFQLNLVEAQKSAAGTERPADYDLLSELLVHRIVKGEDRHARSGIKKAVEIVGEVSDEALLGLTISYVAGRIAPQSGNIHIGLDNLDSTFGSLMYNSLPTGYDWIEQLDLLSAVKYSLLQDFKNIIDNYANGALKGYVDVGIRRDSDEHRHALHILNANNLPAIGFLVDHSLNPQYVRVGIPSVELAKNLPYRIFSDEGVKVFDKVEDYLLNVVHAIYNLYEDNEEVRMQNIEAFRVEWNKRAYLKILSEWWQTIPLFFSHTAVGRVLAHANALRCKPDLPSVY